MFRFLLEFITIFAIRRNLLRKRGNIMLEREREMYRRMYRERESVSKER